MLATFHNHSNWSDGHAKVGEIHAYAEAVGVDILGISDHFCVYPDASSPGWSVAPAKVADYRADVLLLRERGSMEIRVGLEFDWFENHRAIIEPIVAGLNLDYRIGAVHHVEGQQFDVDRKYWTQKSADERDDVFRKYWRLIREMAESSLFDLAAHLDLPKKLGFNPQSDLRPLVDDALDAIAESNMVVELNTAGFSKPCADSYPSLEILRKCRSREIPVTLSSDGHIPEHILFEFERGLARLHEAGYRSIARFRDRQRWFEHLSEARKRQR